jgi:uncharacterized protein (DUF362 family)
MILDHSVVHVATTAEFTYLPPKSAYAVDRILVKPNLGYPVGPPVTVSMEVLAKVLQGLRQVSPNAEILIVEGVCSAVSLAEISNRLGLAQILDAGMQLLDADTLPLHEYPNTALKPVRFASMWAPALLQDVDCCISIGALKRTHLKGEPLVSASLKNLYGLFPRSHYKARSPNSRGQLHRPSVPQVLQDVYFCIGHLFHGAVVDGNCKYYSSDWKPDRGQAIPLGKVFWGDDLIAVDREACRLGAEPIPAYINQIEQLRKHL